MGTNRGTQMGLFGRRLTDAEDSAILREVRNRLEPSFLEPEKHTRYKIDVTAPNLRGWARTLSTGERESYLKWIDYYVRACERRLEMERGWRDTARATISRPPRALL